MAPRKNDKPAMAPERIVVASIAGNDTLGIPKAWLETFMPGQGIEYTQNGVVLCSERQKHTIKIGDFPAVCTISLYITREPVGQEEVNAVAAVKEQRTNDRSKKEKDAQEALAKEKRTMFQLGQESSAQAVFGTLGQMDKLVAVGQMVNRMIPQSAKPDA